MGFQIIQWRMQQRQSLTGHSHFSCCCCCRNYVAFARRSKAVFLLSPPAGPRLRPTPTQAKLFSSPNPRPASTTGARLGARENPLNFWARAKNSFGAAANFGKAFSATSKMKSILDLLNPLCTYYVWLRFDFCPFTNDFLTYSVANNQCPLGKHLFLEEQEQKHFKKA